MRKPKVEQPPSTARKQEPDVIRQVRRYELITPLFGGGVVPGEPDPVTVVRGSEVRGHLRFWWRATRGTAYINNIQTLREHEGKIWGSVATSVSGKPQASTVQICVSEAIKGTSEEPFVVISGKKGRPQVVSRSGSDVPTYAAFPLQPEQKEAHVGMETRKVWKGVAFTLEVVFSESERADIEAALWAWETFGGIGARTRRGFGALHCLSIVENDSEKAVIHPVTCSPQQVEDFLRQQALKYVVEGETKEKSSFPHLVQSPRIKVIGPYGNANTAWNELISQLQRFRQARDGKYGPTYWPEPNAIRRLTVKREPKHPPDLEGKFPRAYFGLPILFHFPQEDDLKDATLSGVTASRMASPLILRPLQCGGGTAVGIALILSGQEIPPGGIKLEVEKGGPVFEDIEAELEEEEARQIMPLKQKGRGQTDVLQAFLNSLKE